MKRWKNRVGLSSVDNTLAALRLYGAQIPVVISLSGFEEDARKHQARLHSEGLFLQLWDRAKLLQIANLACAKPLKPTLSPRPYHEEAIQAIVLAFEREENRALVVLATGLGKTFVASEALRRLNSLRPLRLLAIAHTNELVYQLERSFWPTLSCQQDTLVWNGLEHTSIDRIGKARTVFACLPTVAESASKLSDLAPFDAMLVDECHHVGGQMYDRIIAATRAGLPGGPFLLGLTATPWRPDGEPMDNFFGPPVISVDLITGLRNGFLTNVDYRIYTDNVDWDSLRQLKGHRFSPRAINRTFFIDQWDDGVIDELQKAWNEQPSPKAIIFCGTIEHAINVRDRINARGFSSAAAVFSQSVAGYTMDAPERNRILADLQEGTVNIVCAVDILNEGVDIPDVNIIVFQRVTHSRRIFIQQLGRGLRLSHGKRKVIVLDFVSDIRRFAAGLELQNELRRDATQGARVNLAGTVTFRRLGEDDPMSESFLRQWLDDVAAIEAAGEDTAVLKYPPALPGSHE